MDDLIQEGYICLMDCEIKHDKNKMKFDRFFKIKLFFHLTDFLRANKVAGARRKIKGKFYTYSQDVNIDDLAKILVYYDEEK